MTALMFGQPIPQSTSIIGYCLLLLSLPFFSFSIEENICFRNCFLASETMFVLFIIEVEFG
jgi:uncharacterized membrane protein